MADHPIIFSAAMVKALLANRKTMTRRLLYSKRKAKSGMIPASATFLADHPPPRGRLGAEGFPTDIGFGEYWSLSGWQRVKPGDRLWVRESIKADKIENLLTGKRTTNAVVAYYTADDTECLNDAEFNLSWVWKGKSLPSIHMPRSFSRLTLIVTATKIERLQEISEEDAKAEGIDDLWLVQERVPPPRAHSFKHLWEDLHGAGSWAGNPEVVAISFSAIKANIDTPEAQAA